MIDRISQTAIDHEGQYESPRWQFGEFMTCVANHETGMFDFEPTAEVVTAAAKCGLYDDDEVIRFAQAAEGVNLYITTRATAPDRKRLRVKRAERKALERACLISEGVPKKYWPSLWTTLKSLVFAVPPPWNVIVAGVLWAVERYLGGQV